MMTVPLRDLIEEWEAINRELHSASLESHRRYPFPTRLFSTDGTASAPPSSNATYTRVYHLVARLRYVAEDARYTSFRILQQLLWVTIVAWANQLALASGGVIRLPAAVRRCSPASSSRNAPATEAAAARPSGGEAEAAASSGVTATEAVGAPTRTVFPCSLLPPLSFWDPGVLAEAASGGGGGPPSTQDSGADSPTSTTSVSHRTPNLAAVWTDAVQRIFALWCTPNTPSAVHGTCDGGRTGTPDSHLREAYVWVLFAQHYHRFKAVLSLFFLRYDAHLEDLEEEQQRRGKRPPQPPQQQQQQSTAAEATSAAATFPTAPPLRRRGPHLRVPSDVSVASATAGTTASPPPPPNSNTRSNAQSIAGQLSSSSSGSPHLTEDAARGDTTAAAASHRAAPPLPTTARLLALMVRNIQTDNLHPLTFGVGESLLMLLMPSVHRARLRAKVAQAQRMRREGGHGGARDAEGSLTAPEEMVSAFLDPGGDGDADDEDADDNVVWSAPPSPLLAFRTAAATAPTAAAAAAPDSAPLTTADAFPLPLGRPQQEEYVLRNIFKLLLMSEDCRVYALQHWLVEAGKHVAAVYGAQLASVFFEEPCDAEKALLAGDGTTAAAAAVPALTVHTLADANRVLRETLQSYVRLRTRLLFLNAGTTHFLEALTPWGRTRMLENLNAFLCGFCGLIPPSSSSTTTTITSGSTAASAAASSDAAGDAAQYFTPTNAGVSVFTRTWGVPLWLAMCDDTQQRLDTLQRRGDQRRAADPAAPLSLPVALHVPLAGGDDPQTEGECVDDHSQSGVSTGEERGATPQSPHPRSPSHSGLYRKEPADGEAAAAEQRSATDGRAPSILSADLGDAVSQAPSGWFLLQPGSPTTPAGRATTHALLRGRERGLNLRRVLEQQQQRRRASVGPPNTTTAAAATAAQQQQQQQRQRQRQREGAGQGPLSSDGGTNGLEGSLYSAETLSVGGSSSHHADGSAPRHRRDSAGRTGGAHDAGGDNPRGGSGLVVDSVEAAVEAARQHRRRAAAAAAVQTQPTLLRAPGAPLRFSRAAQLHQVATLPDEGFPSLLYLVPRRSRFVAQDKAAAAVQQELFTRFSSDVHNYLTTVLTECEGGGGGGGGGGESGSGGVAGDTAAPAKAAVKGEKRSKKAAAAQRPAVEGEVRPLPHAVLTRMIFLLDMTYAALQGGGPGEGRRGQPVGPLMETGLTTTGQEQGAAILEQVNGEYESVVSTTLSAPTSPAVLTIAAVRKGFQGFLGAQEKRAVLALAQALHELLQHGAAQQPPAIAMESVDTILNMASLLNSKDMFVSLVKGYLAPRVMMCRSLEELTVESQVVARLAYRLGCAVAAPCLTLLRDLRLAMSDPLHPSSGPLTLMDDVDFSPGLAGAAAAQGGTTAEGAQLVATRDAQTLAAAGPLRHGAFGLIHHMRILCQAWWQPHTAALLPSRKLIRLWERYQLLDERLVDAVLRVEWRYDGHTEPFYGYGRIPGDADNRDGVGQWGGQRSTHTRSSTIDSGFSGATQSTYQQQQQQHGGSSSGRHSAASAGGRANARRSGAAAAVIQGFSSALNSAVRRTGHHAGAFGNNESDNESEDYTEAYGGLLTLNTLQRHRGSYAASTSSYRGSAVSSIGAGAGTGDYWDNSDGGQSTVPDAATSATVPADGERERRQLRWPLGDGQLVFLLHLKSGAAPNPADAAPPVQLVGPPLTLLVCQLLDRAASDPYSFDRLYRALPVQTPKPLLAHLMHELVKAGVVTRSVPAGTRQYVYRLCEDVRQVRQRKVVIDVRAAVQQHWVTRTLTATDSEADEAHRVDPMSPASPAGAGPSFPSRDARPDTTASPPSAKGRLRVEVGGAAVNSTIDAAPAAAAAATAEPSSPAYSVERTHKIKVCIVRIMKAERVLSHRELLERVAAALEDQFVVTSNQLKRCVAHLIEKEFLQRSEGGEEYMYVS